MAATRDPVRVAVAGLAAVVLVVLAAFAAPGLLSRTTTYRAEFTEAAGLTEGDLVTIAGVATGRVESVELDGDHVLVGFAVEDAWLGDRTSASIEIKTLLGSKYLALDPQGGTELATGAVIPRSRTASPLDVVAAFDGLSATVSELDTTRLAASLDTLADTFRGAAPEVRGALDGLSRLSATIAGRDEQVRQLLTGTHDLAGVLADRNGEFERLLADGNLLLAEAQRRTDAITALLEGTRALSAQLSGLVADNRERLRPTLEQLDRVTALLADHRDDLDLSLQRMAVFVRLFTNALGQGRWFDNYVCALVPPPVGPVNPGGC